jgi:hypothetical protein
MNITHYLEKAHIEDLKNQLRAKGYTFKAQPEGDIPYDVLASKDNKTIAFQVKALSTLGQSVEHIRALREQSITRGYDDFQLVVVNPPREKHITIQNLDRILGEYIKRFPPERFIQFSGSIFLGHVGGIEIDSLEVDVHTMRIAGSGYIEAEVVSPEHNNGTLAPVLVKLPTYFTVVLDHSLEVHDDGTAIQIDISDYLDE